MGWVGGIERVEERVCVAEWREGREKTDWEVMLGN